MNVRIAISIIVASMFVLTPVSSYAGQGQQGSGAIADRAQRVDRAQQVDRDRAYDRDRMQDRARVDAPAESRGQDRGQEKIHEQDQDRMRLQDPLSLKDGEIYGNELMTDVERRRYRDQLQNADTPQARTQFEAQHQEKMQQRALEQDKDLVPPGQGPIYGSELMSVQERNEYREQLRLSDSDSEREQFQAQHREQMSERARALNLEIEDAE